ncbi:glycosyltransferase family 2 protein [Algibacter pacificus]|uniref:glycosyltransferase family 2 protein n=1 Tax=Algibacter pacificus TaxID=2599389 RepID=UPI0011C92A2A|nr:glycosyltransferase family 2 protein [Algibacter pacificus]
MPFFSVIIPLYNKKPYIKNTLKSVLNQSFKDFEIIVINDGSNDGSIDEVHQITDDRLVIYNQSNSGVSMARNLGIKKANSKYIALIDADDFWKPNHLQEHYNSIQKFPEADLFCNAYALKLSKNHIINARYSSPKKAHPHIIDNYFKASCIHPIGWTSAITFNKKSFDDIGGFNPKYPVVEDLDLLIKFGLKKTIVFNPVTTCWYDKTVVGSLSKESHHQDIKYELFNSFKAEEEAFPYLKKYLTLNKYSLAIQCKLANNKTTFKKLYPTIDKSLLNSKQRLLLIAPVFTTKLAKKIHSFLIKKNIYFTAYN